MLKNWTVALALLLACMSRAERQLIVRLQPNVSAYSIANRYHIWLRDHTVNAPFVLYGVPPNRNGDTIQTQLQSDSRIVWAEDNDDVSTPEGQSAIKGSTIPAVGGRSKLYERNANVLTQINWSSTLANAPGRTVKVAILDTGLSLQQTYLWNEVDASANFVDGNLPADDAPQNIDSNGNSVIDEAVGHGTMVAGVIDQIDPQVHFVIAKVADSDGNATAWSLIEGLAFAVTSGAEVANISLGSPVQINALSDVMDWCEANRLLVVAAIGNGNLRQAFFPAKISKSICVAGLNPDNTKAQFSNWDSSVRSSAPATGIVSQWWDGHMGVWSGTSFAAPMVTGALADCMRRLSPNMSISTLRNAIKNSGRNIDNQNNNYRGQLGTLLDHRHLSSTLGAG